MSRPIYNDKLMTHQFHVIDVDFSLAGPPWVMLPSAGFSEVTSPEVQINTEDITEGTDPFVYKAMMKATSNTITLRRGTTAFNSDFWRWIMAFLMGDAPKDKMILEYIAATLTFQGIPVIAKRRNLMILHFTGMAVEGLAEAIATGSGGIVDKIAASMLLVTGGVATAAAQGLSSLTNGFLDIGVTSIPGKVYMLMEAMPTRYKPASDFDATTSEVSMEELDLEFHRFEEFSLMG